jgi:glycosyltransferase involved in cell wall biosynthesis
MHHAPKFSIVIPTYNRCELAQRAIDSVLRQDRIAPLQIVVVDDGSTDGTSAILRRRYIADPCVEVLTTPHGHASAARNAGFRAVRGDFVCFLDSDDFWLPDTLVIFDRAFAKMPELAFVSIDGATLADLKQASLEHIVSGDSPGWAHPRFPHAGFASQPFDLPRTTHTSLLCGDFFPAIVNGDLFYLSGLMMRRECVAAAGAFNERLRRYNDWEFFARLCLQGPGGYVDHDGFRRDTGRADQISRRPPITIVPRRHLFILRALLRRDDTHAYTAQLRVALRDAHYAMARALRHCAHQRWARLYFYRCIQTHHHILRSLFFLLLAR